MLCRWSRWSLCTTTGGEQNYYCQPTTIQSSTILLPSNTFFRSRTFQQQQQQQQQQHSKETRRSVFIQTENTPNPESLKFVPSGKIVFETDNGTGYFVSKTDPMEDILRSPLAKQLFRVEGIKAVYVRSIISSCYFTLLYCPVDVSIISCWKIGDDGERTLAHNLSFVGWKDTSLSLTHTHTPLPFAFVYSISSWVPTLSQLRNMPKENGNCYDRNC